MGIDVTAESSVLDLACEVRILASVDEATLVEKIEGEVTTCSEVDLLPKFAGKEFVVVVTTVVDVELLPSTVVSCTMNDVVRFDRAVDVVVVVVEVETFSVVVST